MEKIKKKPKEKPCKHEDGLAGDECGRCGFFEGTCDKCGEYVVGDEKEGYVPHPFLLLVGKERL